ncbi:MAG: CBS domain-containing protein [Deltaproteobacteria bacterium]|nr:CBS domain-containing protein [Deltaproteobacteria bacterium]
MRLTELTVADVMSADPITIEEDATVGQADLEMRGGDIRHLPVRDRHDRLVGMLSNRDLLRALGRGAGGTLRVGDVMSAEVRTVRPESRACEATLLLLDHKIGALPVVDDRGRLVGLVTETDFVRLVHRLLGGDQLSADED